MCDFKKIKRMAENGDLESMYTLGKEYIRTRVNFEKAEYWFLKAAERGHTDAMCRLGDRYSKGERYSKAAYWYRKAIEHGDRVCTYSLGKMYQKRGDIESAKKAFLEGVALGDEDCPGELGKIYFEEGDYENSAKYYLKTVSFSLEKPTMRQLFFLGETLSGELAFDCLKRAAGLGSYQDDEILKEGGEESFRIWKKNEEQIMAVVNYLLPDWMFALEI